MKKIKTMLMIALLLVLTSCNSNAGSLSAYGGAANKNMTGYSDGIYHGMGDEWAYGNEDATFTVKGGILESVNLRKLGYDGNEIDYYDWNEQSGQPNLDFARQDLASRMVKAQSFDVPDVAGASLSCKNWKLALRRAIKIGVE